MFGPHTEAYDAFMQDIGYDLPTFFDKKPERFLKDTSKDSIGKGKNKKYKCTKCGQFKSKIDFYKDNRVPCGIRSDCKACNLISRRQK